MDLRAIGAGAARDCLDLILPPSCAGCRSADRIVASLCARCRAAFRAGAPLAWALPGRSIAAALPTLPAYAATRYEGAARELMVAYKERGQHGLRHELGRALLVACLAADADGLLGAASGGHVGVLLAPAPSRPDTVKERGHDAVRDLAGVAARALRGFGVPARAAPVLRYGREVADQAGLGVGARAANLAGALVARRPLAGQVVIVVDDIITTGATAAEAARALVAAGASVACVAAIAATPRRVKGRTDAARDAAPGLR